MNENKKKIMKEFLELILKKNLLTKFLNDIFEYNSFKDYNYIYRLGSDEESIVIDIYDNVSINRFNRYIYSFMSNNDYDYVVEIHNNVYVHYYNVFRLGGKLDKRMMFGYLFTLSYDKMVEYAREFMDTEYLECLEMVLKKASLL